MAKAKFTIGLKLILIISALVIISLGAVSFIVTYFSSEETQRSAEESNHTINQQAATTTENELTTIRANSFLLLDMLNAAGTSGALSRQAASFFFERNQNMAAIVLYNGDTHKNDRTLINNRFFLSNELETHLVDEFIHQNTSFINRATRG